MADAPALVDTGRAALQAHDWRAAYDAMSAADAAGTLTAEELELLATAAWWMGQLPVAIDARERAYASASRKGDVPAAILAAVNLARDNLLRLKVANASGWLRRAEQLLDQQEESVFHGWLAAVRAFHAHVVGEQAEGLAHAQRAVELGRRFGARDLEVVGLSQVGAFLLSVGRVQEGLALADEATAAAVSGELEPQTAGGVCCTTIESCAGIGDMQRAAEWTEAQDRWCKREGINGYPGMCRLFRSEIKCMRGAWPEAEAEALVAADELHGFMPAAAGMAWYQIGEIRLRRGDLPSAEEALLNAHAQGQDPEPTLSLLRLAQGRVAEAAAAIRRSLDEPARVYSWRGPSNSSMSQLHLLPAAVEILLAAGDRDGAQRAADRLIELGEQLDTTSGRVRVAAARGALELANGNHAAAAEHLRAAIDMWAELDAPYHLARTRQQLAEAYRNSDAADRAALEVRAARATFEALGAVLDLRHADEMLGELKTVAGDLPTGMATTRVVRTFMFTDIVGSTRLAEDVGDEVWDGVMRGHDRTLRSAAAAQGGIEVKATGDGFFFAFPDPDHAIEAAISMQRLLADGPEAATSVTPAIRIGIHQAEANQVGLDYVGSGVNQAARITDAASGGEILVSSATVRSAKHAIQASGRRTLELKGVSAPIDATAVEWEQRR